MRKKVAAVAILAVPDRLHLHLLLRRLRTLLPLLHVLWCRSLAMFRMFRIRPLRQRQRASRLTANSSAHPSVEFSISMSAGMVYPDLSFLLLQPSPHNFKRDVGDCGEHELERGAVVRAFHF